MKKLNSKLEQLNLVELDEEELLSFIGGNINGIKNLFFVVGHSFDNVSQGIGSHAKNWWENTGLGIKLLEGFGVLALGVTAKAYAIDSKDPITGLKIMYGTLLHIRFKRVSGIKDYEQVTGLAASKGVVASHKAYIPISKDIKLSSVANQLANAPKHSKWNKIIEESDRYRDRILKAGIFDEGVMNDLLGPENISLGSENGGDIDSINSQENGSSTTGVGSNADIL